MYLFNYNQYKKGEEIKKYQGKKCPISEEYLPLIESEFVISPRTQVIEICHHIYEK